MLFKMVVILGMWMKYCSVAIQMVAKRKNMLLDFKILQNEIKNIFLVVNLNIVRSQGPLFELTVNQ